MVCVFFYKKFYFGCFLCISIGVDMESKEENQINLLSKLYDPLLFCQKKFFYVLKTINNNNK